MAAENRMAGEENRSIRFAVYTAPIGEVNYSYEIGISVGGIYGPMTDNLEN
jgi:hypothetical protein